MMKFALDAHLAAGAPRQCWDTCWDTCWDLGSGRRFEEVSSSKDDDSLSMILRSDESDASGVMRAYWTMMN